MNETPLNETNTIHRIKHQSIPSLGQHKHAKIITLIISNFRYRLAIMPLSA